MKSKFSSCRNAPIIYSRLPVFPLQEYLTDITTTCSSCQKLFLQACLQLLMFMRNNEKRGLKRRHSFGLAVLTCTCEHINEVIKANAKCHPCCGQPSNKSLLCHQRELLEPGWADGFGIINQTLSFELGLEVPLHDNNLREEKHWTLTSLRHW